MSIWNAIKAFFTKEKKEEVQSELKEKKLAYDGSEPLCMACEFPIHPTERSRKIQGKRIHNTCFRKLKKMALDGRSLDGF